MEQYSNSSVDFITTILARVRASTIKEGEGRFTYIIGNNGSGKSRALAEIANRLGTKSKRRGDIVACIASSIHDRFRYGDSGNIRYLGARNATNAVFMAGIERSLAGYILEAMERDRRIFKAFTIAVGMDITFEINEKSIADLTLDTESLNRDAGRMQRKASSMGLLTRKSLTMLRRVAHGSGRFESLTPAQIPMLKDYLEANIDLTLKIKLHDGLETNFGGLSTGEQNRILTFAKIISVKEERTVFLIDEPELSLHLHWQMDFHETLKELLSGLQQYHVVVATHSPIIISEAVKVDRTPANAVTVLSYNTQSAKRSDALGNAESRVTAQTYSFIDVASHDQLVLKQFHTSPYETREVSIEITDTILKHIEGLTDDQHAISMLHELSATFGLSRQAKQQITAAIQLIEKGLTKPFRD